MHVTRAWLVALAACRHPAAEVEEPPVVTAHLVDAAGDPAAEPAIPVDVEVTARVVDAKVDKAAGTTIVTIAAGANEGVRAGWTAMVVDDAGAVVGRITLIEVKARTTTAATALAPKDLEGKRVRLASPAR